MSDANLWHLAEGISCHAWNKDRSKVAICPNSNEIWIYSGCQQPDVTKWRKEAVLTEVHTQCALVFSPYVMRDTDAFVCMRRQHDMLVCGLDWSPVTDLLVSCSHDRGAFVWKYEAAYRQWKPSLVVLRITRAAINVKWSPNGHKFAVSSGSKCVSVCYYQASENWWVSKIIKKHKSTVTDLDWHPNSQLLVTGSTDLKCRVFSAYISDVDGAPDSGPFPALAPFGEPLAEFDNANAWVNAVAWSPKGDRLAFAVDSIPAPPVDAFVVLVQQLDRWRGLRLQPTAVLVGCEWILVVLGIRGQEANPERGRAQHRKLQHRYDWCSSCTSIAPKFIRMLTPFCFCVHTARSMWESKVSRGQSSDATQSDKGALWTKHESTITDIQAYARSASGSVTEFTTSALDGRIVLWKLASLNVEMSKLRL